MLVSCLNHCVFMLLYSFGLATLVLVNHAGSRDLAYKCRDTVEDIFQQN